MQQVGKNIFSLGVSRVVSGLILFLVYIRLVTYLGPGEFGKYSLVLAYYTIFSLLVDLGISRFVIKRVSEDRSRAGVYMGNFFMIQTLISLLILVIFYFLPRISGYEISVTQAMWLAGIGLFFSSLSSPASAVVQAYERITVLAGTNFVNTLIHALWLVLAMAFHKDIVFVFLLYSIIGLVDLAIYTLAVRRLAWPKFHLEASLIRSMVFYGLPFAFISGFEILIAKIDVVIQKFFLPFSQVGLYSSAYRLIDVLTFVPAVISISLFPYLARFADLRVPEVKKVLNELNRYLVLLAIPLGVGGTMLAQEIVLGIYDDRYLGSVVPFQILVWASVLTFLYAVPNVIMIVKQTRRALLILAGITLLNILLNFVFVPRYGIVASAWITVASYLVYALAYTFYSLRLVEFSLVAYLRWPLLGSGLMAGIVYLLREQNVAITIAAAGIFYILVLSTVGFIRREDWRFVKNLFARSNP